MSIEVAKEKTKRRNIAALLIESSPALRTSQYRVMQTAISKNDLTVAILKSDDEVVGRMEFPYWRSFFSWWNSGSQHPTEFVYTKLRGKWMSWLVAKNLQCVVNLLSLIGC